MRSIEEIVKDNRKAVKIGLIKPGSAYGTGHVKVSPVKVIDVATSKVLAIYPDALAACRAYLSQQKAGLVRIEDVE